MMKVLLRKGVPLFFHSPITKMSGNKSPDRVGTMVGKITSIEPSRNHKDGFDTLYFEQLEDGTFKGNDDVTAMTLAELEDSKLEKQADGSYVIHLPNYHDFPKDS